MRGIITEAGKLYIERGKKITGQGCPTQNEDTNCGDWCPLFGEPRVSHWMGSVDPDEKDRERNPKDWDLTLCRTTLYFDELTDEREKASKKFF